MAISDIQARTQTPTRKGPPCSVCYLLETLPPSESAALLDLLGDRARPYSQLSEELEVEGVNLSAYVLAYHARGKCDAMRKLRARLR